MGSTMKDKKFGIVIMVFIIIVGGVLFFVYNQNPKIVENIIDNKDEEKEKLEAGLNYIDISIEENSNWDNNNLNYSTIKIKISNNSENAIGNWKLVLLSNQDITIEDKWNGTWKYEDKKVSIECLDYNSVIEGNSEIEIGATISYKGELEFLDSELYADEKKDSIEENIDFEEKEIEIEKYSEVKMEKESPVKIHGKLIVNGKNIVDKNGNNFQIQGVSTHSIYSFSEFINPNVFKFFRENVNCNTIRLCVYSNPNEGYSEKLYSKVDEGIQYATDLGLYVIIDWHILSDYDPNINKESAKSFFERMAENYKDYENILYEICNEPNGGTTWDNVRDYATEMCTLIRGIDEDSIIIVGTPNYCKDLSGAIESPLEEFPNILYSFHFYTGSHNQSMRDVVEEAYNEDLPIIVSEFGLSEYTGDGNIDEEEADKWIDYLRDRNIGYICWNISNKDETSALLKSDVTDLDNLTEDDLSQSGEWIKNKYSK